MEPFAKISYSISKSYCKASQNLAEVKHIILNKNHYFVGTTIKNNLKKM